MNLTTDQMLELSLEQMKRLAEIVTGKQWFIDCEGSIGTRLFGGSKQYLRPDSEEWNPSLTGEDWQQVQALRVIVAAFQLEAEGVDFLIRKCPDGYYEGFCNQNGYSMDGPFPNLLHASALALLGDKT